MRRAGARLAFAGWALVVCSFWGCSAVDPQADATSDASRDAPTSDIIPDINPDISNDGGDAQREASQPGCIDLDHDNYGLNCANTPDCDDENPNITDQCYRCVRPATGCSCQPGTPPVACDLQTDTEIGRDGVCHLGQRNCVNGVWARCSVIGGVRTRISEPPRACGGSCAPECRTTVLCPTDNSELSTGSNVVLGNEPAPVFCPTSTPNGGITLPGGMAQGTVAGDGGNGSCTNLCLRQQTCADGGTTTVTGTVYAPTPPAYLPAGGLPDPLYGAVVYVPNGTVEAFTPGISCDQCGTAASGSPLVTARTGPDGRFTLTNVPTGANIPLVIQLGRWRRQVTIPYVTPCSNTALPQDLTRMPRNKTEGDIPLIAMVTGNVDSMECVLRKIGIEDSEFTVPSSQGGTGRVQFYISNGANVTGGAPAESTLWGSSTTLAQYDMIVFACAGYHHTQNTAELQRLVDYTSAGGRFFATHYSYAWLFNYSPFSTTADWQVGQSNPPSPVTSTIDRTFPKGQDLAQWLWNVGASTTFGQIPLYQSRHDFNSVVPPSQNWVYAQRLVSSTGGTTSCATGLTSCSSQCVNLDTDPANCGWCGNSCDSDEVCTNGSCSCPSYARLCSGRCRNTQTDASNCGSCGTSCGTGQSCVAGACVCPTGQLYCSSRCRQISVDRSHCGACGNACGTGQACVNGSCVCPTGSTNCSGRCRYTISDHSNCGSCGNSCSSSKVCTTGGGGSSCQSSCASGLTRCSNRDCVNLQTDFNNCGTCGTVCSTGQSCVGGVCSCPSGQTSCSGICIDLQTDRLNCGSCGNACASGYSCVAGVCACANGGTLCSNRCVDLQSNNNNCGSCGTTCQSGRTCVNGTCTCSTGELYCSSRCRDSLADNANCGGCGTVCSSGATCSGGSCSSNGCATGQTLCNGTCVDTQTDPNNCGTCGGTCSSGQCVTGRCQVTNYLHYTFNTPVGATPTNQCGRAVFSDFHVDNASQTSGLVFPAECDSTPMNAQEKILEFMLFDLASCIQPISTGGPVCLPTQFMCGNLCCTNGQLCQTTATGNQCFTPYPDTGTFSREVDASAVCRVGEHASWTNLVFVANAPTGTSIDITFYTAATSAELATAMPVSLGSYPATASPIDIASALAVARISSVLPFSKVVFTLHSDSTHTLAPTLSGFQVNFNCVQDT